MSDKEVEKKYKQLMVSVKSDDYYTKIDLSNRVNCYQCMCGHVTKTRGVDPGVTPFFFKCEECGGRATSSFYTDTAPGKEPTHEWYRPSLKEVQKMTPGMMDHVLKGGLDVRKINNTPEERQSFEIWKSDK